MTTGTNKAALHRWNAAIWLVIALFSATQTVFVMRAEGMHHAWAALYVVQVLMWLPWAIATPPVLALAQRFPIERPTPITFGLHVIACGSIDLAMSAWTALLEVWLNPWAINASPGRFMPLWFDHVYNGIFQSVFLYAAILAAGYIVLSRQRLAQQQIDTAVLGEALTRAQLEALRRQIEPHFLFNALNSVVALIREGRADTAASTLVALSDVLRGLMDSSGRQEVALAEELGFLDRYLEIQKVRFADRLCIEIHIADELLSARVPCLVLQPLVENAIRHGIAKHAGGGSVRIAAVRANGRLDLSVYNDGPQLGDVHEDSGVGLANVRARLRGLYGDEFAFALRNANPGVEANVSLPYRAE
ncbi:sensor histidine kinase [Dokdonella soli]|uniref:Histidine kinase n=1 Tax=Dokdonella soli TaxID=529810 RepID=A0ABP3TWS9_9GAMM